MNLMKGKITKQRVSREYLNEIIRHKRKYSKYSVYLVTSAWWSIHIKQEIYGIEGRYF